MRNLVSLEKYLNHVCKSRDSTIRKLMFLTVISYTVYILITTKYFSLFKECYYYIEMNMISLSLYLHTHIYIQLTIDIRKMWFLVNSRLHRIDSQKVVWRATIVRQFFNLRIVIMQTVP